MLKKSVSNFLVSATGKSCIFCYRIMLPVNSHLPAHTPVCTVYVTANTTKLCTPRSVSLEKCYLRPHLLKKIFHMDVKLVY